MPQSSQNTPNPFPEAPAPWHLKGEVFWFFGYNKATRNTYPPAAAFGDLERATGFSDPNVSGDYKGGLASIMVVRYLDTPVGPYDELLWIPGTFAVPQGGRDGLRITRIYVSSNESVYNGRKNWNIPKSSRAHFEFTPNTRAGKKGLPYSKISVADLSDPEHPFFVAELSPSLLSSTGLPFSTAYTPLSVFMAQPPLPQSPNWREDGQVGTDSWVGVSPLMKGKAGVFWQKGGLPDGKYGDGIGFPDVKLWSFGMWLRDAIVVFGIGEQFGAGGDDNTEGQDGQQNK